MNDDKKEASDLDDVEDYTAPNDEDEDEDDAYLADPFVRKLHLIRDITHSPLNTLVNGFEQAFGQKTIQKLLTECCLQHLAMVSDIDEDRASTVLRECLIYNDEQFNPNNPALLNVLPKKVLSKCFSYLDCQTLLCGVEMTCRDWLHVARIPSSCGHLNVNFDLRVSANEKHTDLERFHSIETLEFSNSSTYSVNTLLKEIDNDLFEYTLSGVDRLMFRDCVYVQFLRACPDDFLSNLRILEIDYRDEPVDASFWTQLTGKCSSYLQILRLKNLLINKKNYSSLNKFIETCPKLVEFVANRWKFEPKMNINDTLQCLSNNCRKLTTLTVNHCRIDDKATPFIVQLMALKLQNLSIIGCKRLKNESYKEIGRKQELSLCGQDVTAKKAPRVLLRHFEIDDEMIASNIFDQFVGLKSLLISADHLSGTCKWGTMNRFMSLRHVEFHFRSKLERMHTHSQFMFDWEQFFKALGKTLELFICNCIVSDAAGDHPKANTFYTSGPLEPNPNQSPVKVAVSTTSHAGDPLPDARLDDAPIRPPGKKTRPQSTKSISGSSNAPGNLSKTPTKTSDTRYANFTTASAAAGASGSANFSSSLTSRPQTARFRGVTQGTSFDVSGTSSLNPNYVVESFTGQRRSSLTNAISFLNAKSDEFMIIDAGIFRYIVEYCKKLKVLKMSGWKFDTVMRGGSVEARDALDASLGQNKKQKSSELVRRSSISKSNSKGGGGHGSSANSRDVTELALVTEDEAEMSGDNGNIDVDVVDVIDESDEDFEAELEEEELEPKKSAKKVMVSVDTGAGAKKGSGKGKDEVDTGSSGNKSSEARRREFEQQHPKALKHRSKSVAVIGMQQLKYINGGNFGAVGLDMGSTGSGANSPMASQPEDGLTEEERIHKQIVKDTLTGRKGFATTESSFEQSIMDPLSSLFDDDAEFAIYTVKGRKMRRQLEHVQLEWLFDFGDIPALSTLSFWSDVVLGLKLSMTLNEKTKDESVVIMEWSDNWEQKIRPKIIHRSVPKPGKHMHNSYDDDKGETIKLSGSNKKKKEKGKRKKVQFGIAAEQQFD